jgi:hypothetical protein
MNWEYNQEEELCNIIVCCSFLGQAITSLSDMPSLSTLLGVGGLTPTAKSNIGIDFKERIVHFQSAISWRRRGLRTWSQ